MLIASVLAHLLLAQNSAYRAKYPLPDLTVSAGWGVNANFKDLDDDDISRIADMGAKWVRMDLLWSRVEQKDGEYDFSKYDPILDGLDRNKMRAVLILDYGNKVHQVDSPRTREGRAAFAQFASEAVKHFRHRGVIWEIWNEPNLSHFWRADPSADEYAAFVRVVVPAMRTVSSDEWIMGPGASRFDWPYLEESFKKGILQDLDIVSVHPYRDQKSPDSVADDWTKLRVLIDQYGNGKKISVACSEWGYSTYPKGVSEDTQGSFAIRTYLDNLASGVPLTIWYSWRDRSDASNDKEKHFGLVDADGHAKGGHDAVADAMGALNGYAFDSRVTLGDGDAYAYLLRKGTSRKLVCWSNDPKGSDVRFPATIAWFAPNNNRQMHLDGSAKVLSESK